LSLVRTTTGKVKDVRQAYGRVDALTSFGEGPDGELYAVGIVGGLYRLAPRS
jgi:hypothetical protein